MVQYYLLPYLYICLLFVQRNILLVQQQNHGQRLRANGNIEMNESNDFHHNLLNKIDEIKTKLTDKEYKDLVDMLHTDHICRIAISIFE